VRPCECASARRRWHSGRERERERGREGGREREREREGEKEGGREREREGETERERQTCRAQPRATDSDELSVRHTSFLKKVSTVLTTAGMRLALPTSSTDEMSSTHSPLSMRHCASGASTRESAAIAISSSFSRVMEEAKSVSSIRHSTFMGASGLAESTFLSFSLATFMRSRARAAVKMSSLVFAW
jgi:hypothetical protein